MEFRNYFIISPRKYGTRPGLNSRPLDLQSDSHLLPDTLPTALRELSVSVLRIFRMSEKFPLRSHHTLTCIPSTAIIQACYHKRRSFTVLSFTMSRYFLYYLFRFVSLSVLRIFRIYRCKITPPNVIFGFDTFYGVIFMYTFWSKF